MPQRKMQRHYSKTEDIGRDMSFDGEDVDGNIRYCSTATSTPHKSSKSLRSTEEHARVVASPGFAICLLVLDYTIRLHEWVGLAYHYTVLPLSSLFIGVDPKSSNDSVAERNPACYGSEVERFRVGHYYLADHSISKNL